MAKTLELAAAEREANEIGKKFAFSNDVMADMSKAYHTDFSDINIHTDAAADAKVKGAGKDAIASGRDIYFGAGIYESKDPASKGLVAHELAHTMQQGTVGDGKIAGVSEHAPEGAEQGGIVDIFKNLFKRKPKIEFLGAEKDTSEDAKQYMWLMNMKDAQTRNRRLQQIRNNTSGIVGRQANVNQASPELIAANKEARKGAVKESNASWNTEKGSERHNVASAYREFGYRTNRPVSRTDRAERGAMFGNISERDPSKMTGFNKQLKDYFNAVLDTGFRFDDDMDEYHTLNKADGTAGKDTGITRFSKSTAADFMTMLSGYLESEEGIRYLSDFYDGVKDADVFREGQDTSPMRFVLQSIMNSEVSRLQNSAYGALKERNATQREQDVAQTSISRGSSALVMKLAAISGDSEQYANLPADIRALVDQYNSLLTRLEEKIGNR